LAEDSSHPRQVFAKNRLTGSWGVDLTGPFREVARVTCMAAFAVATLSLGPGAGSGVYQRCRSHGRHPVRTRTPNLEGRSSSDWCRATCSTGREECTGHRHQRSDTNRSSGLLDRPSSGHQSQWCRSSSNRVLSASEWTATRRPPPVGSSGQLAMRPAQRPAPRAP
jgi:hypothetical protein